MLYVLSHPRLTKSSRPLAQEISKLAGEEIIISKIPLNTNKYKCIIRYGNSTPMPGNPVMHNPAELIRLAGNKKNLSTLLLKHEFPHVELYMGDTDIFPVVVRTELNRGGGIGIEFCDNIDTFRREYIHNYWSYYYPFSFELGVHILGGKIVKVFKKVREDGLEEEKFPRRNTNNGYKFSLRENWEKNYSGLIPFVEKLYNLVPISFARLDVGYDKQSGGYRLIEINSAPDLSQNKNTLELYAEYLAEHTV